MRRTTEISRGAPLEVQSETQQDLNKTIDFGQIWGGGQNRDPPFLPSKFDHRGLAYIERVFRDAYLLTLSIPTDSQRVPHPHPHPVYNTNIYYYHWRYILLMQGILFGAPGTHDRGTPMSALGSVESLNHWNGYEYHTPNSWSQVLSRYFNLKTLVMSLLTSACHGNARLIYHFYLLSQSS